MRNSVSNTGGVTYDQIFRAIGDRHRLQILTLLREKEMSAGEILKALDVVQSTLSHHMKSLVDAGAVSATRHGKWTYYSLNAENLTDAVRFLDEFSEGTRTPAQFEKEEAGTTTEKTVTAKTEEIPAEDLQRPGKEEIAVSARKSVKEKDSSEKKKSKKGKKGKKSKK